MKQGTRSKNIIITKLIACFIFFGILFLLPYFSISAKATPAKGIDVSYHNGYVNWQSVKNDGISFAFVRVGSTKSGIDKQFVNNIVGANNAGLRVGVYIYSYATSVDAIVAEAEMVLSAIENYTVSFPVVVDIEDSVQKNLTSSQLATMANAFCKRILKAGYYPMVYSSRNWFMQRIGPIVYDKWVAQYAASNTYPGSYGVWQYTSSGSVSGVATRVDLNYLYGDYASILPRNGFKQQGKNIYYFKNYRRISGWIGADDGYYYAAEDFKIVTGWFGDGDNIYYFNPNECGRAMTELAEIDGEIYYFSGTGKLITGFVEINSGWFYFDPDAGGALVRNTKKDIDGISYIFDEGGLIVYPSDQIPGMEEP